MKTLYDKIWENHVVAKKDNGMDLIYIDRHLIHEVTSPQAFEGLRSGNRSVRKPSKVAAVADHNTPTKDITNITDPESSAQLEALGKNVKDFGIEKYYPLGDFHNGIVHVTMPEQGLTLPGTTLVCGDSHTTTHGAFGSIAFGIGTSQVEHVLATQTLPLPKAQNMKIEINGKLTKGVYSKDLILYIIGEIGTKGGTNCAIEFCGSTIESMSMEERMTICNMAIEAGARFGLIAPDETTIEYLRGRKFAPKDEMFEKAATFWRTLHSDKGCKFDKEYTFDASKIEPQVTWGTSPEDCVGISETVPVADSDTKKRALEYMGLTAGTKMTNIELDVVFIGSCTNSRIEDLRIVADLVKGMSVNKNVQAIVVPGSGVVKKQAEEEGLAKIFTEAGFEWRNPGCSMCLAMNSDKLKNGQRCASTSNRNFEGRQGRGGRTHLVSPAMAAMAAVHGKFVDVRPFIKKD